MNTRLLRGFPLKLNISLPFYWIQQSDIPLGSLLNALSTVFWVKFDQIKRTVRCRQSVITSDGAHYRRLTKSSRTQQQSCWAIQWLHNLSNKTLIWRRLLKLKIFVNSDLTGKKFPVEKTSQVATSIRCNVFNVNQSNKNISNSVVPFNWIKLS